MINSTRPQNLELIYNALANSGNVTWENNGSYGNTVHAIKTDIKAPPTGLKVEHKPVRSSIKLLC